MFSKLFLRDASLFSVFPIAGSVQQNFRVRLEPPSPDGNCNKYLKGSGFVCFYPECSWARLSSQCRRHNLMRGAPGALQLVEHLIDETASEDSGATRDALWTIYSGSAAL